MSCTVGRPKRSSVYLRGSRLRRRARIADQLADFFTLAGLDVGEDALDHRVGLRVHRRGVQRVVAARDAQEAGGLLEGLLAQARHVLELGARGEGAVLSRQATMFAASVVLRPEMRLSSGGAGGIHVDADGVHAVLDHRIQRPRQARLVDVVLVLADADALGSIFTSSASGSCRRRAIDTAPRRLTSRSGNSFAASSEAEYTEAPASDTVILVSFSSGWRAHQLAGQLVGLAAGRAVADGDQAGAMLLRQQAQRGEASPPSRGAARAGRAWRYPPACRWHRPPPP
jgi:hypothetical protein